MNPVTVLLPVLADRCAGIFFGGHLAGPFTANAREIIDEVQRSRLRLATS